jgi:hypothetical protein
VVGFAVVPVDDDTVDRGEYRATEADEPFRRFRAESRPPVTQPRRETARIDADEVDRVPLAQQVGAVAGNATVRTVLRSPEAGERQEERNLPAGTIRQRSAARIAAA